MSVCNVDLLVSSILGRPPATGGLPLDYEDNVWQQQRSLRSRMIPSVAPTFKLLIITHRIIEDIYVKKDKSLSTAERHLETLKDWRQNLPTSLQRSEASPSTLANQKEIIAKIHISCLYYFAVTLVTRPALILSLTAEPISTDDTLKSLASACQDAAIYMSQTCTDAIARNLFLGNMCFIQ